MLIFDVFGGLKEILLKFFFWVFVWSLVLLILVKWVEFMLVDLGEVGCLWILFIGVNFGFLFVMSLSLDWILFLSFLFVFVSDEDEVLCVFWEEKFLFLMFGFLELLLLWVSCFEYCLIDLLYIIGFLWSDWDCVFILLR